ncbi:DUF6630 family protein [Labedella endophytica]|uniref:DUF6630 domain-containing protein n=1 Tax=Labedella endophytica TaxID=1523160 RepID=A0A3S0VGP9_9MICO|nr:hypothetical protein [Labedella endophytica]RUR01453.1 hypothetical protein ELQ94_08130 [Labedella endophytica]
MTADDWTRLCGLLDDDPELSGSVLRAFSDPADHVAGQGQDLPDRGTESADDVDPWFVMIDGLDESGALAYLDGEDSGVELADALAGLPRVFRTGADTEPVADVDGGLEDAIVRADEMLAPHGLRLVFLAEDSDAYPLVAVPSENVSEIVALAERLGHEARTFG